MTRQISGGRFGKSAFRLFLSTLAALATVLPTAISHAGDDVSHYHEPGFSRGRDYQSHHVSEHIDPFNGNLIRSYVDIYLPGNGGFDLKVQRTYNLINVASDPTSPFGRGWNIHFGRVKKKAGTSCSQQPIGAMSLELPDGSSQSLYTSGLLSGTSSSDKITTQLWRGRCLGSGIEMTSPDGMIYEFTHNADPQGWTTGYWMLTRMTDRHNRSATFSYTNLALYHLPVIDRVTEPSGATAFDFSYDSGRLLSVTGRGAVWQYTVIRQDNLAPTYLTRVVPPAGGDWDYVYNGSLGVDPVVCDSGSTTAGSYALQRVTYPHGGQITYSYKYTCFLSGVVGASPSRTVSSKTSSVDGTWTFNYSPSTGVGAYDTTTVSQPGSLGTLTYRHFGYRTLSDGAGGRAWKTGLLYQKVIGSEQTETYTWTSMDVSTDDVVRPGYGNADFYARRPLLSSKSISRDGSTFQTTYSSFDSFGNPQSISENGPSDRTRSLSYSNNTSTWILGLPLIDHIGGVGTTRTYWSNGNLHTDSRFGVTTTYNYYPDGSISSIQNGRGYTTSFSGYVRGIPMGENRAGLVTISRTVNANTGDITSETDGVSSWGFSHDAIGRLTSVNYPLGSDVSIAWGTNSRSITRGTHLTTESFDGFGRRTGITRDGVQVVYTYDGLGRKRSETVPGGAGTITYTLDELGRPTQVSSPAGTRYFVYGGSSTSITNERGHQTTYGYDRYADPDSGFLRSIAPPVSSAYISIGRDVFGHMTSVSQDGVTRTYGLNGNKFVTSIADSAMGTTTFGRDGVGNMTSKTTGGVTVNYGYDGLDRMTSITYGGTAGTVNLTYDDRGKVTRVSNNVAVRDFVYDANGNRTQDTLTIDGRVFTATYDYGALDGLDSITYPNSRGTVYYNADRRGRPTQASPYLTGIGYHNASNNLNSLTYANGRTMSFSENAARQLPTGLAVSGISVDLDYTYDPAGNIIQINYLNGVSDNKTLGYDAIDRLVSWGAGKSFSYDGNGDLTQMLEPGRTRHLAYAGGKLSTMNQDGLITSFNHDSRGNITAYSQNGQVVKALDYDNASQVTCVFCGQANEISYAYDGNGSRVKETKGGKTTYYFHGANNDLLYEYTPYGKTWKKHVYLHGKRVATKSGSDATVTNITLTTVPVQPVHGSEVQLRAAISPASASGTVEFSWGGQTVVGNLVSGVATISVSSFPAGTAQVTASYDGDANHAPVTKSQGIVVNKRPSSVALTVAPETSSLGGSVTLTATVTGYQPSGTVEFRNNGASLGVSAISGGTATFTLGPLLAGDYQLSASYAGDDGHLGSSTASPISLSIAKQEPTLSFTATPQSQSAGQLVTLTATLGGPVLPTGFVTFKTAAGSVLSLNSLINGTAFIGMLNLPVGSNQVLVEYGGDVNYLPKSSSTITVEVAKASTQVQLTPPSGNLVAGQTTLFTATVSGYLPAGSVRLLRGGATVASAALVDGVASFRIAAKSGSHAYTAAFDGDANNLPGTSNEVQVSAAARTARNDLDGDGRADIVMHDQSDGTLVGRLMNGLSVTSTGTIAIQSDTGWQIAGSGDFDGDRKVDLLWRHGLTGQIWLTRMNGTTWVESRELVTQPDTLWHIEGVGDFNGDGMSDLLWRHRATGEVRVNLVSGYSITNSQAITSLPDLAWRVAAVADFDGDGKADILWHHAVSGQVGMYKMDGVTVTSNVSVYGEPDTSWRIMTAGDVNGDGMADIIWQNRSTGQVYIHLMNGTTILSGGTPHWEADLSWRIVSSADYDGDGKYDILWHNTLTGQMWVHLMNGLVIASGQAVFTAPSTFWKPVADIATQPAVNSSKSDLNLDSRGDLVWSESAGGAWSSLMRGREVVLGAGYSAPAAGYQLIAINDFNGDGRGDLLWFRDSDRLLYLTLLGQSGALPEPQSGLIGTIGAGWELKGITDLNQDGKADLVWYSPQSREASGWFMDGRSILPSSFGFGSMGPGYEVIGAADFNGDGRGDILWFNHSDRTLRVGLNRHGATTSALIGSIGSEWELRAIGDMNGDGRADLLWYNPQTRQASAWFMSGSSILPSSMGFGTAGEGFEVVGLLDLSGDRRDDIVWLRASDRSYYATIVGHASAIPEPISGLIGTAGAGSALRSGTLRPGGFENQGPVVSVYVPRTGDSVFRQPADIGIVVSASDPDGVAKLEYFANETKIAEFAGPPYPSTYVWQGVTHGNYAIKVRATDTRGASSFSNVDNIFVSDQPAPPPTPWITLSVGPSQGPLVAPATVNLLAEAGLSGNGSVVNVEFFANDVKIGEDATEPFSFRWVGAPAGTHILYARAITLAGASRNSSPVTVTVTSPLSPGRVKNDLNGDGKSDLIWQNADRVTQGWLMNGTAATSTATLLPQDSEWRVRHIADFNGDGKDDLLLQGEGGSIQLTLMNGLSATSSATYLSAASAWRPEYVGDINGDGKADILFSAEEGTWVIWLMDGLTKIAESSQFLFPSSAAVQDLADLNGDGKSDLIWVGNDGLVYSWLMDGNIASGAFPPPAVRVGALGSAPAQGWHLHSVTDLDGDHRAELLWQHPDGRIQFQRTDGVSITSSISLATAGSQWVIAGIGDFDGDGHKDLVLEDVSGQIAIWRLSSAGVSSTQVIAVAADRLTVRHVADFNGDGKSDLVLQHEDSADALWLMNGFQIIGTATPITPINSYEVVPGDGTLIDANSPPEVALSVEGDRRIFVGQAALQILATGSDLNGSIVRMQLFRNGIAIADVGTSSESFNDILTTPGTFNYFVRATDNQGATRDSAPVAISVAPQGSFHFDDDAKSDILWRNTENGDNYLYFMDGLTIKPTEGYIRNSSTAWSVAAVKDFDGDGKADIFWRNATTGENYLYFMDGKTIKPTEGYFRTVALNWIAAGSGDFDGDGKADILWRNTTTGENYIYFMDGLTIKPSEGYTIGVGLEWTVAGIADFDGDGKSDILLRNPATGQNYVWFMDGKTVKPTQGHIRTMASSWNVVGTGDFDGDGRGDVLWEDTAAGQTYVYFMDGLTIKPNEGSITSLPAGWSMAAIGDYDGDGKSDILLRNQTTGANHIWFMDGRSIKSTQGSIRTVTSAWVPIRR